jgi:4-amino-4-deoxy-L-arabinose transferase-like glycosyltransferase
MRHRILLAGALVYLTAANIIWIVRDTRPPFWDMAGHELGALRIYNAVENSGLSGLGEIPRRHLTGSYPPFYHLVVAGTWAVFGKSVDVAQLANLPALAVLMFATYGIAATVLSPWLAAVAAVLTTFYPYLLWMSRETIIDYWLSAIVAAAMWALIKTKEFSHLRWSLGFGALAGIGMLTKWTFPFFLILPAIWCARRNWKNAAAAAAIAAAIASVWYIPSMSQLAQFAKLNTAGGVFEGDPDRLSFAALTFYVRALEGYQLFLPLFVAFLAGAFTLLKHCNEKWLPIILWLVGGWLGLLLFQNKDPRYSAPLLAAVAVITAAAFRDTKVLTGALLAFLIFQHYLVSFGIKELPESVVLMKGAEGQLSWHWNLYTQSYFGLWGPPARENWKIEHVLNTVGHGRLGLVPDIPRFDSQAFLFYIELLKLPIQLNRVAVFDPAVIQANDYLLIPQTTAEHAASFAPDPRITEYIRQQSDTFQVADEFSLPNGEVIRLYKVL